MTPKFFPYMFKDSETHYAPFVTLHGSIEQEYYIEHGENTGWESLVCNVNPHGIPDGIYDAFHFGKEVIVYIWSIDGSRKRGLAVYADDYDAAHYARECMATQEKSP